MGGISLQRVQQLCEGALRDLRRDWRLRKALDNETLYYHHQGVSAFNTSWTSITEKVALWGIEMREHYSIQAPR